MKLRNVVFLPSLFLRGSQGALALLLSLVLARFLGTREFGWYAFGMAVAGLMGALLELGAPMYLVQCLAALKARGDTRRGAERFGAAALVIGAMGSVLSISALFAWRPLASVISTELAAVLVLAVVIAIWQSFLDVSQGALRGLGRVLIGQLGDTVGIRALVIGGAILCFGLLGFPATAKHALELQVAARCSVTVAMGFVLFRVLGPDRKVVVRTNLARETLVGSFPFLLLSGLYIAYTRVDVLMLGAMTGPVETGVYRVASAAAAGLSLAAAAIQVVVQPRVSAAHAVGDTKTLQSLLVGSGRLIFLVVLPGVVAFAVWPHQILGWFGPGYGVGAGALIVLSAGQLVSYAFGPGALALEMTGHQRISAIALAVGLCVNVVLNATLIPRLGALGAAVATATSLVAGSALTAAAATKKLHIGVTLIGGVAHREEFSAGS